MISSAALLVGAASVDDLECSLTLEALSLFGVILDAVGRHRSTGLSISIQNKYSAIDGLANSLRIGLISPLTILLTVTWSRAVQALSIDCYLGGVLAGDAFVSNQVELIAVEFYTHLDAVV